jgi:hypothetical protein
MKTITQQSIIGGVDLAQDDIIIHLSDDDIARLIQVRFCFERMTYNDLIFALTIWQNSTGVEQVSLEQVMTGAPPGYQSN